MRGILLYLSVCSSVRQSASGSYEVVLGSERRFSFEEAFFLVFDQKRGNELNDVQLLRNLGRQHVVNAKKVTTNILRRTERIDRFRQSLSETVTLDGG